MTTPIVFPPTSAPGIRPQESGGRLINAFAEQLPVGSPSKIIIRRSPGLQTMISAATGGLLHTRGFLDVGSQALWILDNRIIMFNSSFLVTNLGALFGTDYVTTAKNNAVTPNLLAVTSNGCFNLFTSGPPTAFADPNLPSSPTSVCDYNGYFIWSYGSGVIFASGLNSVVIDPLSFTTEQGLFVRRVVRFAGRLYAFGDKWTGVYRDVGSVPFPLTREVTIPRGIVGTHAIAGWETGWANELIWVGDDFVVYQLNGYTPNPVSTDDVSRNIQQSVRAGKRDKIAAFVYMHERNAFWVLTCEGDWTWEYNVTTGEWNERLSYEQGNWKGLKSIRIFDRWLIGSRITGELFQINGTFYADGSDPLVWTVESGVIRNFPRGMCIPRTSFDCTMGTGFFPTVPDPKITISWSLDGGYTYSDPVIRSLGGPGRTKSHPYVLNCGLSKGQGVRYRLSVSDPVHVGLMGGVIENEPRGFSG